MFKLMDKRPDVVGRILNSATGMQDKGKKSASITNFPKGFVYRAFGEALEGSFHCKEFTNQKNPGSSKQTAL